MYSILIVEDDPVYRDMMEMILQMEGFEVRSTCDGGCILELLREKRPDLILCDILMPENDGYGVLEILKNENEFAEIPFIFVTALGARADIRRGMAAGADDYLAKPFQAEELIGAVTGRIRRHEIIKLSRSGPSFQQEQAVLRQKITRRETEVLLLVGAGSTSREIAQRLGITPKTAEVHRANLMKKLDAANAASLARWAFIAETM